MGKFLVCVLVATAAAMVAATPQSHYRGGGSSYPSYRGFARDITDYGIYKLMSAIQGGGRGHRELLGAASGIRNSLLNPSGATGFHAFRQGKDFGYMTPPPRGSKSYYYNPNAGSSLRGGRPDVLKDTYILSASGSTKSKSPYPFTPAILSSGPSEYSSSGLDSSEYSSPSSRPSEYSSPSSRPSIYSSSSSRPSKYSSSSSSRPYSSPPSGPSEYSSSGSSDYPSSGPSEYPSSGPSEYSSSESSEYASSASPTASSSPYPTPGSSSPPGSSTITVTSDQPLSLQEIVAKAAQEQHQKVLAREQQSHPGSVVSHNIRLAPQYQSAGGPPQGSLPPQYQQQILAQQGQPGQQRPGGIPQHLYNPQQQYAIQGGAVPQVLIRGPPPAGQQILVQGPNGQPMLFQLPQGQPPLQYIPQGAPGQPIQYIQTPGGQQQVRIAQQPGQAPPQYAFPGQQPGLIPYQQIPQQGFPIGLVGQPQFPGQQIYTLPGPHGFFPQNAPIAPEGLLGQPQFALSQQEQQQIQTNQLYNQQQQQQQQAQASEQISESASEQSEQISAEASSVSVSTVEAPAGISAGESSLTGGSSDDPVTAALIQSHTEYSEPVHKIE